VGQFTVSNQGEHAFWGDPAISHAPIFVTADYTVGADESHYSPHRYIISAYLRKSSTLVDGELYYLEDQYMTVRKYDREGGDNVLASEQKEILSRLRRVKAAAQ
jgi:hypothetical protein